jgi:hypothetical protein
LTDSTIAATGSSPPSGSGPSGSPKPSGGSSGDTSNTNAALKKEEEDKDFNSVINDIIDLTLED